jgi:hypothetical protein
MSIVKIRAALEMALNGMEGLIPKCAITSSAPGNPTVFSCPIPHGMIQGISVKIVGHTGISPDLNSDYIVQVVSPTTISLLDEITQQPIASAVAGAGGFVVANLTAWENMQFNPVAGAPMQRVYLVPAKPENPSMGSAHTRELGHLYVILYYPVQQGTFDISTRAELLKSTFKRGASFTLDEITVHIPSTCVVTGGEPEDEFYIASVRIPYWCDIFN